MCWTIQEEALTPEPKRLWKEVSEGHFFYEKCAQGDVKFSET